ncbi:MAG: DJ-1/PfpI family protein [Candidatus Omnitrophica bacterium]|nr:DJ-1/PfpI family protein [Candidatus Omnitrophota bacterium]
MIKKVIMVISHTGFRDEELLQPKEILESNNIEVRVASTETTLARGKLGAVVSVDILLRDIPSADFDALFFIGGPGCIVYWDDPLAHKLLKEAFSSGKIVGGICSGCVTLARSGILKGKRATVFPGDSQELLANGANYTASPVEKDGNIITASGPDAAVAFAEEIVKALAE